MAPERPTRFPTHIGPARRAYKGRLGLATPADSLLRIALPRDVPRPPRPAVDTRAPYPTWRWIYRQGHCSQYASLPALQIAFAALHQRLLLLSAKAKRPGTVSQFAVASFTSSMNTVRCRRPEPFFSRERGAGAGAPSALLLLYAMPPTYRHPGGVDTKLYYLATARRRCFGPPAPCSPASCVPESS